MVSSYEKINSGDSEEYDSKRSILLNMLKLVI